MRRVSKPIVLIRKKNNLRVQHTFLYISFQYFCTTKTGNFRVRLYFYEGIALCANETFCCLCSCSFYFSLPLVFTLLTASISHFLTTAGVTAAVTSVTIFSYSWCSSFILSSFYSLLSLKVIYLL